MKASFWNTTALAVLMAAGPALLAANGQTALDAIRFSERQPSTGVYATSMGGVGMAGLADHSAFVTNPAGLALFGKSAFTGSLSTFSTQDDGVYRLGATASGISNDIRDTRLGHLAYIHKVPTSRGSLVVGAALTQVQSFDRELFFSGANDRNSVTDFFMPLSDEFEVTRLAGDDGQLGTDDDEFDTEFFRPLSFIGFETFAIDLDIDAFEAGDPVPFLPAVTTGTVDQIGTVTENGAMHEFNLGGAIEASQGVMVGVAVNVPFGKWQFDRVVEEEDSANDNDGLNGTTDFDYLRWSERIESDIVGVNVRTGVSWSPNQRIRAGLSVETPTYLTVSEDYSTILETEFDNGDVFRYGDDSGETVGAGSFDYEVITPWKLGVGLGFSAAGFSVNGDVEWIDWSQLELDAKDASPSTFADENRLISQNLEPVVNTRIGAEYKMGNFAVRAGLAYNPDPRETRLQVGADGSKLDRARTFYSAGFSYQMQSQFAIDFGWTQERFDDEFLPYQEVADAPFVREEISRNRFSLGVRVFF